jgi:hypothetical protein
MTTTRVAIAVLFALAATSMVSASKDARGRATSCLLAPSGGYRFVTARDGKKYLMNDDEPDAAGWLGVLSALRTSLLPALGIVPVAADGTVFSDDDGRLTETEFARVERVLRGSGGYSGVHSVSFADSGTPAVTTCGDVVFLSSVDFHSRGWRQENVHYLLHELAHVATDPPDQKRAHTLEFYRVLRVLTRAAESLGKGVYDPAWYSWPIDGNVGVNGAWNGSAAWYDVAKKTLKGGYRWNDRKLEKGADWYLPGSGSFVTAAPVGA